MASWRTGAIRAHADWRYMTVGHSRCMEAKRAGGDIDRHWHSAGLELVVTLGVVVRHFAVDVQ